MKELSPTSAQLKKAAGLDKAATRRRYRQQRVEGIQAVRELLTCAPQLVRDVCVTQGVLNMHPGIAHILRSLDIYVHVGDPRLIAKAAPSSQGIFAVASFPETSGANNSFCENRRENPIDCVPASSRLLVCCVQANDPGNVGTIIRTADAAGAGAVFLGEGSADPTSPKVIRSAAGSTFHLPILLVDAATLIAHARAAGFQILAAAGNGSVSLYNTASLNLTRPTLWLVGNEAHGLSDEQLGWADIVVRIPMWGASESLNLAVATGLCLYASALAQH